MPDTDQASTSTATSDQASTQEGAAPSSASTDQASEERIDADTFRRIQAELKDTRKEAANYRTKLKGFEDAQKTEAERLADQHREATERAATLEQQLRAERATNLIARAAAKHHLDPDDAARFVALEWGEDGQPKTDLDAALGELAKAKPYLVQGGTATPQVGATNPGRSHATAGTFTTSQIEDRAFWSAHSAEILVAMREGRIVEG